MTFDPELGWRPLPHVRKVGGVWGVNRPASTNSRGWRDSEHALAKPFGVRRVVALGDSFTFGTDVDDGDRFTDVLPQLLPGTEVVNLGVAGYGTDQELRVLETEALGYGPDVIVLTACVLNDLEDIGYERLYSWPKPTYRLSGGELKLRKPQLTWDIQLRTRSYLAETIFQRFWNENLKPRPARDSGDEGAETLFSALVQRMATVAGARDVKLVAVLAYVPASGDPNADRVSKIMRDSFDRSGIRWLDTRDLFRQRSATPDRTFYASTEIHWNAAGHAIVAEGLKTLLGRAGSRP
jgi:hypothetical protein